MAARRRAGAPGHDDMLDCLANVENTELLRKVVWPIAPRRDPVGGGMYRRTEGTKDGGWIVWEVSAAFALSEKNLVSF